jgi:flagellar basal body rod protein FlgG
VAMIQTARQFELNARMISMQDESLGRLVNELPRL